MLYDEEFILLSDSIHLLKTVNFTHFQSWLQFRIIFWDSTTNLHNALIMQKRIKTVMLGLRQRKSCTDKYKKLQILTVPSLYILEIIMFVIKNPDAYQTNVSSHSKDTRQKNQFNLQSQLLSIQNEVCYSSIRMFNELPLHIANYVKIQWHSRTR